MKRPWHSRTLGYCFAKVALALVGLKVPGVKAFVVENPESILLLDAMISVALRIATKEIVVVKKNAGVILPLLLALVGCASVDQKLEPGVIYKRDLDLTIDGYSAQGVGVIPERNRYEILIKTREDIDVLLLRSCHREEAVEKVKGGWFSKTQYRWTYEPIVGIETNRVCPLRIEAYNSTKEKHFWSFLARESKDFTLPYETTCNGEIRMFRGVGVCQAKRGLVQRVRFTEPVRFAPPQPSNCATPKHVGDSYEIPLEGGECLFMFDTKDGRRGYLVTIGYEGIKINETQ